MTAKIVECVPNISNGTNPEVFRTVAAVVEKVPGVKLLDVDPGAATNRTVITFAGAPGPVLEAAFQLIVKSKELIDMRTHKGAHPRMGAVDVCPFVPVSGLTLEECAEMAKTLGKRVGEQLGVWVYLYEAAASRPERKNLANCRKGEYEGLVSRMGKEEWRPDFGAFDTLDPKFGACVIGARKFLVAYNINVNSANKKWATDIASNIRESGRAKRTSYPDGDIVKNADGSSVMVPGKFTNCKANAWIIPEYNRAQITMNLTDTDITPLHKVFEECENEAYARGVRITGSEIVGLVPLKVILDAGRYFLHRQGLSVAVSEGELVTSAMISLGLSDVSPFDPEKKIIEYNFKVKAGKLVNMSIEKFCDVLASDAPAPGGGSVAALCGALAAALGAMVANLTHGKPAYKNAWDTIEAAGAELQVMKAWFIDAVDDDTKAFNEVMEAMKMPSENPSQASKKKEATEAATQHAALVPLSVVEKCVNALPHMAKCAELGNPNCLSDIGAGAHTLLAAAESASLNVKINLKSCVTSSFTASTNQRLSEAMDTIHRGVGAVLSTVSERMSK